MDQESRDANNLLVELDKGLKSPDIGDQSEAVARFTSLFQRFPLPILINSACLKLAEAYRCGSNFLRVQICEVLEQNQSHLNKIYNLDEFFRNIFTVTTSNDPIARLITLLTLGNIAPIVSGYKSIHHCISSSLESTVECELNATIVCAACYVKQSSEFACNIYPKIVSIIDSDKVTTDVRIRALSVLDHGFYNAHDAMTVRSFLIGVIEKSKLRRVICTCLTLSTKIAYTSLSHISPQIRLLLQFFKEDSRLVIKLNALKNLKFLAEKSPHIWETEHVEPLVTHLESNLKQHRGNEEDDRYLYNILTILCKLLTCKCNFISPIEKMRISQLSYKLAIDTSNIPLCSMAFELLTVMSEEHSFMLASNITEYQSSDLTMDTLKAIKEFLTSSSTVKKIPETEINNKQQVGKNIFSSKPIYRHIVKLCKLNPHYCSDLLKVVFNKVSSKDISLNELCPYVTELMCAVTQLTRETVISPETCWKFIKTRSSELTETNLLNLCVLYFQILKLRSHKDIGESFVEKITQNHGMWFGFKVMRQAMRYGHYGIALPLCEQLHEHVTTDTTDFYFKSLGRICVAESTLQQGPNLDTNLKKALPLYEDAVSPLRASIGNTRTTNFQLQFLWLRIRTLQAHSTLRQCCKVYETSPITYTTLLNAIGATRGVNNNNDLGLSKLGLIQQMPKIAKDFRSLGDCYESLSLVSFNCDNRTLDYIHLLQSSCIIMADSIDAIFQYGKNLPVIGKLFCRSSGSDLALEHRELEETCIRLIEIIKSEIVTPGILPVPKFIDPLIMLLRKFSDELLKCPFVYPRYFFQPLQMTHIKLAITPQPSSSSGTVVLILNYNFVLKVEGLIQNQSKTKTVIREVSRVTISITMNSTKPADLPINFFVQSTTTPYNNYFKTEFLIPLKCVGSFNVDIDVSIIDEQENTWKTGPTERLNLTVS